MSEACTLRTCTPSEVAIKELERYLKIKLVKSLPGFDTSLTSGL